MKNWIVRGYIPFTAYVTGQDKEVVEDKINDMYVNVSNVNYTVYIHNTEIEEIEKDYGEED